MTWKGISAASHTHAQLWPRERTRRAIHHTGNIIVAKQQGRGEQEWIDRAKGKQRMPVNHERLEGDERLRQFFVNILVAKVDRTIGVNDPHDFDRDEHQIEQDKPLAVRERVRDPCQPDAHAIWLV